MSGDAEAFGARWAGVLAAGAFPSLATGPTTSLQGPCSVTLLGRLKAEVAARLAESLQPLSIPVANIVLVKQRGAS